MSTIKFLTVAEVIHMHRRQVMRFGGMHGIRDISLLESAVLMPQSGFGNEYLYKDHAEKGAA